MSQTPKLQRMLVVSGSSEYTLSVSQAAVPTHVEPSGSISRATDGSLWRSLDGGNWMLVAQPDGSTLSAVTGVLNALPLSGTMNSGIVALSGTINARFKSIWPAGDVDDLSGSIASSISHAGAGTPDGSTLSAVTGVLNALPLSGTINARFKSIWPAGDVDDLSGSIASAIAHAGGGGGGSGVGYLGAWSAGTYTSGAIVSRNGYTFGANKTTSEDPLFSEGDISSSANWLLGSSGINNVPISGGYAGAPDTYAVFVNNQTSKTGQAISKSTGSDWNGKIIAYDAAINGSADAFSFGIMDAAYPFTSVTGGSPLNGVPTAWGVYVDIFNQQIKSLVDGTSSAVQAGYSTANATAKGNFLDRWYVSWALTGSSSASIEFWRNDASNLNNPRLLVKFTVPKPTYTAYRVAAGGWSGGIAGTFYFRGATTRVSSSGDWTRIGSSNPAPGLA